MRLTLVKIHIYASPQIRINLKIKISITNKSKEGIHLILDHPKFYTGGLWYDYHFDMIDSSDSSVLYCDNRAMLASISLPTKAEINEHVLQIDPSRNVFKEFSLKSLITTKPIGKELNNGNYRLRMRKGDIESNWVEFVIRH